MVNDDKGAYRNAEIQGDVLPGFRGRDHRAFHQRFLMVQIVGNVEDARAGLEALLTTGIISTGQDVGGGQNCDNAFVNAAFTACGLERLGRPIDNSTFNEGLAARSVEKRLLGDPVEWRIGREPVVDVVFNIGATDADLVHRMTETVLDTLGAAYAEKDRFDGALLPEGREHFGFRDGIAQPFVADDRSGACPGDGGTAVWPNWTALRRRAEAEQAQVRAEEAEAALRVAAAECRYATGDDATTAKERWSAANCRADQAASAAENARRVAADAAADKVDERRPGVPIRPAKQFIVRDGDEFTMNGSYMVWLQLEQRPAEFWAMCRELATNVRSAFDEADEDLAAALLMGRTLDGNPLPPHPGLRTEDFSYYTDPFGRTCPAGAHIRLVNPRDVESAGAMVLRRGIPYGAAAATRDTRDGPERGLIFVCYQADIAAQYEELQGRFANADYDKGQPVSRFPDAIIGQDGHNGSVVEIPGPRGGSVGTRLNNTWVVPRGGLYLFVPSMAGLRILCHSRVSS